MKVEEEEVDQLLVTHMINHSSSSIFLILNLPHPQSSSSSIFLIKPINHSNQSFQSIIVKGRRPCTQSQEPIVRGLAQTQDLHT
jgi:hypothetical protein